MVGTAVELVRECRTAMQDGGVDAAYRADCAAWLDQTAGQIDTTIQHCRELLAVWVDTAAWLRLAADLLRGEDVPDSIHVPHGEDPFDTARWQKWRVS
jgi:hypothetical protein